MRAHIKRILSDAPRSGSPSRLSTEQKITIIGLACEPLPQKFVPQSRWDAPALVREALRRGIVTQISVSYVTRLLERAEVKPHKSRYWMNPHVDVNDEEAFGKPVRLICKLYREAQDLNARGIHMRCEDEKTGIQAIERLAPDLPTVPGKIKYEEPDYIRWGTRCLIGDFDVASGQITTYSLGDTRTEEDFVAHIAKVISSDPTGEWRFILDNLNTHVSAGLVE